MRLRDLYWRVVLGNTIYSVVDGTGDIVLSSYDKNILQEVCDCHNESLFKLVEMEEVL